MIYERDLKNLVVRERIRAITKGHSATFNSLHEGYCVMKEEQEEFEEEYAKTTKKVLDLWNLIKKDKSKEELLQCIKELKESCNNAFDEFVMFLTMVDKIENKIRIKE